MKLARYRVMPSTLPLLLDVATQIRASMGFVTEAIDPATYALEAADQLIQTYNARQEAERSTDR